MFCLKAYGTRTGKAGVLVWVALVSELATKPRKNGVWAKDFHTAAFEVVRGIVLKGVDVDVHFDSSSVSQRKSVERAPVSAIEVRVCAMKRTFITYVAAGGDGNEGFIAALVDALQQVRAACKSQK